MDEFTKNLYIIYTDENSNFTYKDCKSFSMSSVIFPYEYYKEEIETEWNSIKLKYNVDEGVCLHFTDIKALLNPKYFDRDIKVRNENMEKIFCKDGTLDKGRLKNFYHEILNFIKEKDFTIITTVLNEPADEKFDTQIEKKYSNPLWYKLFRKHLNDITKYVLKEKCNLNKNNKKLNLNFKAKIRYDGDYGLSNKNDIRNAFSHSITTGTDDFNSEVIRECFDELRFINKAEVGYCSNCNLIPKCTNKNFSHAGNEIIDFIALYSGRYISKGENIKYHNSSFNNKNGTSNYKKSVTIKIDDEIIKPLDFFKNKIYKKCID